MSPLGALFVIALCICILILPRQYSALPFFLSIMYLTRFEKVDLAGFSFFGYRIVLFAAAIRIIMRGEIKGLPFQKYELLLFANLIWIAIAAGLREKSLIVLLNNLSTGFDAGIAYLFARSTFNKLDDIRIVGLMFCIIMVPLMLLLVAEKHTLHNFFSIFNGAREVPLIRNGKVRAAGPFAHAILAGTVAAVHIPLAIYTLKDNKIMGVLGCIAILGVIYACSSSGPIMSFSFAVIAMAIWYKRDNLVIYRNRIYASIIVLEIIKLFRGGHVWDLLARIDLTGSSTGWHRSALITSWLQHFNEWWLIGTNFTRHWMPTGVTFSPDHTDITNHYIAQAVNGGTISIVVFIYLIYRSFKNIGICLQKYVLVQEKLVLWSLGSILFAHTATFISVAYFDQTILLYFFLIGTITAIFLKECNLGCE